MKPYTHAKSSARKWGGKPADYMPIHQFLDSSKATVADWRHRSLTHNAWFLSVVLERVFGVNLTNSDGKEVSVREVGEQHVMEDLRCIPTAQDFLQEMELQDWMGGRGKPASQKKIEKKVSGETVSVNEIIFD